MYIENLELIASLTVAQFASFRRKLMTLTAIGIERITAIDMLCDVIRRQRKDADMMRQQRNDAALRNLLPR